MRFVSALNSLVTRLFKTSELVCMKVFDKRLADQLTIECLRYMYRILFVLFIEARPELGYAPMKSQIYGNGW